MIMSDEKAGQKIMSDELFASLLSQQLQDEYIDFVKQRFGIIIKREHKELAKAIKLDCEKNNITPDALLDKLKNADDESESLNRIISAITIGETYFFRDKLQVKVLSETVLPAIIKKKIERGERAIRIWSAGCSSGEEIYTIIMLLKNIINDLEDWQYFFLATDINIDVLKKGISGQYSEWSMRSIPHEYLHRYFTKNQHQYQLSDDVKKFVTFDYLNLNSDLYPSLMSGTMMHDLIVCRNVLIYFDTEHAIKIINRLSRSLSDDGYILLGASDPVAMLHTGLYASRECASLFTRKPAEHQQVKTSAVPLVIAREHPKRMLSDNHSAPIAKHSIDDEQQVHVLAGQSKWDEVLALIAKMELSAELTSTILTIKATGLANTGHLDDALRVCEDCLNRDKMSKDTYFIYALILSRRWKESESSFRKALYIDPDFLLCRYQLGLFLIRHGKHDEGKKALMNVIKSAGKHDENEVVADSNNMRYKDLIAAVTNIIELHK
jgi:chemotaxis protein methyltransferase CheR